MFTIGIDFGANSAARAPRDASDCHPAGPQPAERRDSLERGEPLSKHRAVYDKRYALYRQLHDGFDELTKSIDLSRFMMTPIETTYAQW